MKYLYFLIIFLILFLLSPIDTLANTYYVSNSGSDTNSGTQSVPLKTIAKCVTILTAGDSCILRGGTYPETVSINKQGTSANPITLKNFSGEKPIIDGQSIRETMTLTGANYIVIDGLTLINSNSYALYSYGSNNISVINSEVDHPLDGGLVFRNGSNILVNNSDIHHTNSRGIGASHEAISMANINGYEIKNNQIRDNNEEGICSKTKSTNGTIHNNKIFGNNGPNIYIGTSSNNIDVFDNEIFNTTGDKANIGLSAEVSAVHDPLHDISIFNNIIRGSKGGISFWVEPGQENYAKFDNINIFNNLIYQATSRGAIRIGSYSEYISNLIIKNNIFWKNSSTINTLGTAIVDYNLFDAGAKGSHALTVSNAGFVNESGWDFHLTANSPAINAGTAITTVTADFDDVARPQGAGFDLGPYEFQTGNPTYNDTDLEPDGDVDIFDFNTLVNNFGETGIDGWIRADIVKNGIVDLFDFNKLIENFGE